MPTPVVGADDFEAGRDGLRRDGFEVFRQAYLVNEANQVLTIYDEPAKQTPVNRQVFRSRFLHKHPLVLALAEHLDLLVPNRDLGIYAQLRIIPEDKEFRRAPLSFQSRHVLDSSLFRSKGQDCGKRMRDA